MKNIPISVSLAVSDNAFKGQAISKAAVDNTNLAKTTSLDNDASIVSVPKNKLKISSEQSVENALNSFLDGISNDKEAKLAHGNLDPARVIDLLSGLED